MKVRALCFALAGLFIVTLAACGGGGSSADDGQATSGLVPAAPAIGATLVADATTLRPLRAGAAWDYRGTAVDYTGATPATYRTTTTQSAADSGGAAESYSNGGNFGAGAQAITVTAGQVVQSFSIDYAGMGTPLAVDYIELRSPVRVGDQYVSVDRHYSQTAIDADGDGKSDALDVAVYTRVIGPETLTLPNLPALQAVRVDTVQAVRLTYSSTSQPSDVSKSSVSTWYVAGVGIVRQTTSMPTTTGDLATTDEQIEAWDGITAGLGAMAPVAAVIPADSTVFPGQALPAGVSELFAFAFGDHALVLSDQPGLSGSTVASRVDLRGNVLGATLLDGLRMGSSGVVAADGNGVVYLEPQVAGAVKQYDLTRIDANGLLVGAVRGQSLTALGGSHVSSYVMRLTAALDGGTLWVLWSRSYYDPGSGNVPGTELVLRPFGLDGAPLSPEVLIHGVEGTNLSVAAAGGRVLLTWTRVAPGYDIMFGSTSLGGDLQTRPLAIGLGYLSSFISPLVLNDGGALLWPAPLGSGLITDDAAGVLLDTSLLPVPAAGGALNEEISGLPPFDSSVPGPAALGSRIVVTATQSRALLPHDADHQQVDSVNWIDTGSLPLADSVVHSVRYASRHAMRQAVFADRVLVFGGAVDLTTTVVWLNKGD